MTRNNSEVPAAERGIPVPVRERVLRPAHVSGVGFLLPGRPGLGALFRREPRYLPCESVPTTSSGDVAVARLAPEFGPGAASAPNMMTSALLEWLGRNWPDAVSSVDTLGVASSIGPLHETIQSARGDAVTPEQLYACYGPGVATEIASAFERELFPAYSVGGCIAGLQAIGALSDRIRLGASRNGLAVGVDYPLPARFLDAYAKLGMLQSYEPLGNQHRPWSRSSSGMVLSEGVAAVLVSAEPESPGVPGRIIGWDSRTDGYDPFRITTSPDVICSVMMRAAGDGERPARTVLVMAHANALRLEDDVELRAIRRFARLSDVSCVLVATVKHRTGHALACAGILQTIAALELLGSPRALVNVVSFVIGSNGDVERFDGKGPLPVPEVAVINARSFGSMYASLAIERAAT